MKTSIKTFAVALAFVAAAFSAQAGDKENKKSSAFGTGIYATKSGKINVLIDKASNEANTTLLLKNENGEIVYRETVNKKHQKFGRSLNVSDLDAGQYKIDIISGGETQTKSFQVGAQKTERLLTVK